MGTSGWDDEQRGRGRSPRDRRGFDDAEYRGTRGGSSSRGDRYDRADGGSSRYRDERPARGSADERERGRPPVRDDWRSSSDGRRPRRADDGYGDERRSFDRSRSHAPRDVESPPSRSAARRRPADWEDADAYAERYDRRAPDRSPRGQRPVPREDNWAPPNRARRAPADASSARGRVPERGGLWDDEAPARRRMGDGDVWQPGLGGQGDPRALRRGLISETGQENAVPAKSGMSFGRAVLIIVVMFLLGSGLAFGLFKLTAPKASPGGAASPSSTAPAAASSTAAPSSKTPASTTTPHAAVDHVNWIPA